MICPKCEEYVLIFHIIEGDKLKCFTCGGISSMEEVKVVSTHSRTLSTGSNKATHQKKLMQLKNS